MKPCILSMVKSNTQVFLDLLSQFEQHCCMSAGIRCGAVTMQLLLLEQVSGASRPLHCKSSGQEQVQLEILLCGDTGQMWQGDKRTTRQSA
jgi:hypothetical protein